ncbi:MAG TPA: hypothetical protein PLF81_31370, partial [Candidatus Anammoximicrobium sp.]|nr:hypothetical protein [Candidatus Anammoximicrobium sp.]
TFLTECEGLKAAPVTLEQESVGKVIAQWTDKKIPQLVQYDVTSGDIPVFPTIPPAMAENDSSLWSALAEATNTTDADSIRYATNCMQLHGIAGKIVATDGRQLLVQTGFCFPWEDDLLVPSRSLFACRDLPSDGPLLIGRSDTWLTLQTGPWTFHLAIDKERRFPRTEDHIRRPEMAVTRLTIAPADAEFLCDAIERLPCDEDGLNQAVTVDLNGHVIVRAQAKDSKVPTELVLNRSAASGEDMVLAIDRTYLARAIKLGFRELCLYGPEVPLQACSENRVYVWAPLGVHGVIQRNSKAVRIDSADGQPPTCKVEATPPPRRKNTMAKSTKPQSQAAVDETANGNGNGSPNGAANAHGSANGNGNGQPDAAGSTDLIEQAEVLRSTLRTATTQVGDLIAALKQQKKATRSVQTALATLRQLEKVAL